MTTSKVIGVLVAMALLVGLGFYASKTVSFGANATGPAHWQLETFLQGIQLGQRGTVISASYSGTCNLSQSIPGSFLATTTQQFYCTVTGVSAGDLVIADLPVGAGTNASGSGSPFAGFIVTAAYATSTNTIGVTLANFTGAATSSFTQATTTVEYRVLH